jgi:hypothetical protein
MPFAHKKRESHDCCSDVNRHCAAVDIKNGVSASNPRQNIWYNFCRTDVMNAICIQMGENP